MEWKNEAKPQMLDLSGLLHSLIEGEQE